MQVILLDKIVHLGNVGDQVNVKERNSGIRV